MKWRRAMALPMSAACCAIMAGAISTGPAAAATGTLATAARATASTDPAGHLGAAQPVPGLAALNAGGQAQVLRLACPSPGACTAAGSYVDAAGRNQAFVASERNFSWGNATPVPGLGSLNGGGPSDVTALSCADATHCAVGGWFVDTHGNLNPFVAEMAGGTWGTAHGVVLLDPGTRQFVSLVTALSCPAPGDCTAAVTLPIAEPDGRIVRFGVFVPEVNGTWGVPQGPPGFTNNPGGGLPEEITALSCWLPGNCLAGGTYTAVPAGNSRPFIDIAAGGTWDHVTELPGINSPAVTDYNPSGNAQVLSVACTAAANCAVSGVYTDHHGGQQAFEADDAGTGWNTQALPGSAELNAGGDALVNDVSCGAPFDCAVAGQATDSASQSQAMVAGESGGLWRNAQQVPGVNDNPNAAAFAVSCTGARHCMAGGYFTDTAGHQQGFLADENADTSTTDVGTFGGAVRVAGNLNAGGTAAVNDVSCSVQWECAAGGYYTDAAGNTQGFIATQSAHTATTLALSAGKATFGREQSAQLTATVTPRAGGTPAGQVTILANGALVCTATLASGTAKCAAGPGQLKPGSYQLTAAYSGDPAYGPSTSAAKALTVTAEPTTTALTLSAAKLKADHEQAGHLIVTVKPQASGVPAGKVTVKAGATVLCAITLTSAKGTCTLAASKLRAGTYQLTATYPGTTPYAASTSPGKTLTITR